MREGVVKTHHGRLTPSKDTQYPFCSSLDGPRVGMNGCRKDRPIGVRSPNRPVCSESLHRLSYRGRQHNMQIPNAFLFSETNRFIFLQLKNKNYFFCPFKIWLRKIFWEYISFSLLVLIEDTEVLLVKKCKISGESLPGRLSFVWRPLYLWVVTMKLDSYHPSGAKNF
jgi:hypothetical protein